MHIFVQLIAQEATQVSRVLKSTHSEHLPAPAPASAHHFTYSGDLHFPPLALHSLASSSSISKERLTDTQLTKTTPPPPQQRDIGQLESFASYFRTSLSDDHSYLPALRRKEDHTEYLRPYHILSPTHYTRRQRPRPLNPRSSSPLPCTHISRSYTPTPRAHDPKLTTTATPPHERKLKIRISVPTRRKYLKGARRFGCCLQQ